MKKKIITSGPEFLKNKILKIVGLTFCRKHSLKIPNSGMILTTSSHVIALEFQTSGPDPFDL